MTTAGQRLVSLSGLPSGSAQAHLLAITTGTGTGPGETIYAPRMTVITQQRTATVTSRPKRSAPQVEPVAKQAKAPQKQSSKYAYAFTSVERVAVLTQADSVFITQKLSTETVTTKDDAISVSRRKA